MKKILIRAILASSLAVSGDIVKGSEAKEKYSKYYKKYIDAFREQLEWLIPKRKLKK